MRKIDEEERQGRETGKRVKEGSGVGQGRRSNEGRNWKAASAPWTGPRERIYILAFNFAK
jgi:hypothetical protein